MNFFGMGGWEIMIILVVALVVFGPERLPEIAGKIGKTVRDLRQMSSDLTGEFERSAGVQEFKKAIQGEVAEVKSQVTSVTESVKRDLDKAGSTVTSTVSSSNAGGGQAAGSSSAISDAKPSSASAATASAPTVVAVAKASKTDPLADVSFLEELSVLPASSAKPAVVSVSTAPKPNGTTTAASPDSIDALTRARQRRVAAGYNRRPT